MTPTKHTIATSTDDLGTPGKELEAATGNESVAQKKPKELEDIILAAVMKMSERPTESSPPHEEAQESVSTESVAEILSRVTTEAIQRAELAAQTIPPEFVQTNAKVDLVTKECELLPICHVPGDNRPYVKVWANGVLSYPLLDCGSMITLLSYICIEELRRYNTRIEPCNMTITTVNKEDNRVTGVMWLEYKVVDRTAIVPTIVMQSHSSYFIAGMDFWRAFSIKLNWSNEENPASVIPWNEKYRPDCTSTSKAEVKEVKRKRTKKGKAKSEMRQPSPTSGVGMLSSRIKQSVAALEWRAPRPAKLRLRGGNTTELKATAVTSENPNKAKGIGMLSPAVKRSVAAVVRGKTISPAIQLRYETYCNEIVDKPGDETWATASESDTPTTFIRKLLKEMPRRACQVQEVAIAPAIRTASGESDSYEDVRREKHTCVTEPHELTDEQKKQLDEVLSEFPYTPENGPLNCTPFYQQKINTADAKPIMKKQYPMSPYIMAEIEEELQNLIERDIIEPIDYSPWRWPILWVRKKSGGGRICLDARGLNKITVRDAYPTLKVETILQNLPSAKFVSCLDMTQAFHQIAIRPTRRS